MSEYEVEPGGARTLMKTRDNGAAFEFEDEVLVHRADIEQKKTEIRYEEIQVMCSVFNWPCSALIFHVLSWLVVYLMVIIMTSHMTAHIAAHTTHPPNPYINSTSPS